jgi:hypothetical protein
VCVCVYVCDCVYLRAFVVPALKTSCVTFS